jgi:hypothetical protein
MNTTMRALWRTASTSHFFLCKVCIFISFSGGVFLSFFLYLCFLKDSWSAREGGSYYFFKEGDLKTILRGGGGVFYQIYPPPLYFTRTPLFRKII